MNEPLNGICPHAFIRNWLDPQLTSGPLIAEEGCRNCEGNYLRVGIHSMITEQLTQCTFSGFCWPGMVKK